MNTPAKPGGSGSKLTARRPSQANGLEKSLRDLQDNEGSVRFNVDLKKDLHKRLKLYSVQADIDMTEIVRGWIEEKLDQVQPI